MYSVFYGYFVLPIEPILTVKCEDWELSLCFLHVLRCFLHVLHVLHVPLISPYSRIRTKYGVWIRYCGFVYATAGPRPYVFGRRRPHLCDFCARSVGHVLGLFSPRCPWPPVSCAGLGPSSDLFYGRTSSSIVVSVRFPWKHLEHLDFAGISISDTIPAA